VTDRLTRAGFGGVWAGVPTPWTSSGDLDPDAFEESVAVLAGWGVDGIYTTGSTGEFHALDDREFALLMEALERGRRRGGADVPTQAGVSGLDTRAALRRSEAALAAGADSLQVALPCWAVLTDDEVLDFVQAIARAFPGVPILHYNSPRAGRLVDGPLYARLADIVPELLGAKTPAGDDDDWAALRTSAPDLAFMVGETLLPRRVPEGARGTCSSYVYIAPELTMRLFAASRDGDAADAQRVLDRIAAFEAEAVDALVEAGFGDAAIDKALAEAAGFIPCGSSVREPYRSVAPATVADISALIRRSYEDFLEVPRLRG
jgi:4-hydroxy-tetrahydrodipicolinate synthase